MASRSKGRRQKNTGRARRAGSLGWVLGAAALGMGAGLAVERVLVGRTRIKRDPYAGEEYGKVRGDRTFEVPTSDGAVIVADEVGPKDLVSGAIFLHGFCLDRTIWHHQYRGLDPGRRYVFYDARHHGACRGGKEPTDVRLLASDLKAVIDGSGLEEVVLVGHSMGGMTVLEFCREFPEETGRRVKGLVLVNTTYTDAIKTLVAAEVIGLVERRTRRILERVLSDSKRARLLRLRGDDFSWLFVKLMGFGPKASPSQIDFVQNLLTCFPSPRLVETLKGIRDFDIEKALSTIDVPTLIIAGSDDRVTTVRASRRMADEIDGARLVVFERAGHMAMLERHEEFNAEVGNFIESALVNRGRKARRKEAKGA